MPTSSASRGLVRPINSPVSLFVDNISIETTIDASGTHHVQCNRCKEDISLTKTGHFRNLIRHQEGKQCEKRARHKKLPWFYEPRVAETQGASSSSNTPTAASANQPPIQQSIPQILITDSDPHEPCPGIAVDWVAGSIWATYPYHRHLDNLNWNLVKFDKENNRIFFQSSKCSITVTRSLEGTPVAPCLECQGLVNSEQFRIFKERAIFASPHTPWDRLTYQQLDGIARRMGRELKALQIKLKNAERRFKTFDRKIDDYKRIVMLIANNEIVGLRRLTAAALRHGSTAETIANLIEKSLAGLYSPRSGFTERDFDIAFLVKAIGGPRLLYALNKSHGLVSESTIRRHRKIPRLLPSITAPSKSENDNNMTTFLDPEVRPPPSKIAGQIPGNVLMFDGVALETRCRYCPRRNQILGLCREHSNNVTTEVNSAEDIDHIRHALLKEEDPAKKVCFGSDATVVAVAAYAQKDHNPVPLIVSPSDKTEKWTALKEWVERFLSNYAVHEFGECLTGPMWTIASDGDAVYRRAKHEICTTTELDPSSSLGQKLGHLLGLNTFTSSECIVWTCDPKHIMKRFATLLRSKTGLMIEDTNITATDIIRHLATLPGMSPEKAIELLDPGDKQNVPKAVSLIQNLLKLKDYANPTDNQFDCQKRHHINFLAHFLGCFVLPFIDVEMSLSEQLKSLSQFAHLAGILQLKHGSSCLTGALYADTQATIKNLFFTTARLQSISPNLNFYIILEGTDRLENLFSDCRTQDHARNFDIDELSGKLSAATLINAAFERNPDIKKPHRRLNLKDVMGLDRVNPRSWEGNTRVGDVDLRAVWNAGRDAANNLLEEYFGTTARFDQDLFGKKGHDLQRPNGKYVGVDSTSDDMRSEEENPNIREDLQNLAIANPTINITPTSNPTISVAVQDVDQDPILTSHIIPEEEFDDLFQVGETLEDLLPDDIGQHEDPDLPAFSKTLEVEGKFYLKASLVATLTSNRAKKVTMRPLRAAGMAVEDLRQKSRFLDLGETQSPEVNNTPVMKSTDLGAFLARSGGHICLAIIEIAGFRLDKGKETRSVLSVEKILDSKSGVTIVGQVIQIVESARIPGRWEWSGRHISLNSTTTDTRVLKSSYIAEIPSFIVQPIHQYATTSSDCEVTCTWSIESSELQDATNGLWDSLNPENSEILSNLDILPEIKNPDALPYRAMDGDYLLLILAIHVDVNHSLEGGHSFLINNLPFHLIPKPKLDATSRIPCRLCNSEKPLNKMREHVGQHILRFMRGVEEEGLNCTIEIEPCGFCGLEGCLTELKHKSDNSRSVAVASNCNYHYEKMQYKSAMTCSASSPCTNVPIHCPICPPSLSGNPHTVWKYNMVNHLLTHHAEVDPAQPYKYLAPEIPGQLLIEMFITKQEERLMSITEAATDNWRTENQIPNSDGLEEIVQQEERQKRERSGTVASSTSRGAGKKRRKR
ncbi:hypothetical protein BJ912DRAFT_1097015 [Pholiota molesta]|nr:hypothetical protein BJ912DRAFT_1097015 [Pholiota molesta]